jgi:transaldolase
MEYASWHKHVIVKVPMTVEGLKTIKALSAKGVRTNCTLVFSVAQAMLAAKAGAYVVSPFVGRLDDRGEDGMQLAEDIMKSFRLYHVTTQCIVASIRNVEHVKRALLIGADIATIPYKVMVEASKHELTDIGVKKFQDDWEAVKAAGAA